MGKKGDFFNKKKKNVFKKGEKRKKRRINEKNDSFCCVFSVKIAHPVQKPLQTLKWGRICEGKLQCQREFVSNVKMGKIGKIGKNNLSHEGAKARSKMF